MLTCPWLLRRPMRPWPFCNSFKPFFGGSNVCLKLWCWRLQAEEDPNRSNKKFLGDTSWFCPVALKEQEVLSPGNPEIAARYKEKTYYLSTPEARERFLEKPWDFLPVDEPFPVNSSAVSVMFTHCKNQILCYYCMDDLLAVLSWATCKQITRCDLCVVNKITKLIIWPIDISLNLTEFQ